MARLLVVGDENDLPDGLAHHLREAGHQVSSGESAPDLVLLVAKPREVIELGVLRVERSSHKVWVDGNEVALTNLELRLLCTLFDRRPRVQTRERLLDDVWGSGSDAGPRSVDTTVRRLRKKLQAASRYIATVHGAGYRFDEDTKL